QAYREALSLAKTEADKLRILERIAISYNSYAGALLEQKKYPQSEQPCLDAIHAYREALSLVKTEADKLRIFEIIRRIYFIHAKALFEQRKYSELKEILDKSLEELKKEIKFNEAIVPQNTVETEVKNRTITMSASNSKQIAELYFQMNRYEKAKDVALAGLYLRCSDNDLNIELSNLLTRILEKMTSQNTESEEK
ncbi:MAG: hypothetical protein K1060chlam1_00084, partial [Candidatus Anoxychlamydiales bacterium]|nr:hypothetical protein [Candidatus Anoxychlamydiales bacterium]